VLREDPYAGHVFERLERGRFVWPQADSGSIALSSAQLAMLLEGIDRRRPERIWQPSVAV
jgi:transposase